MLFELLIESFELSNDFNINENNPYGLIIFGFLFKIDNIILEISESGINLEIKGLFTNAIKTLITRISRFSYGKLKKYSI